MNKKAKKMFICCKISYVIHKIRIYQYFFKNNIFFLKSLNLSLKNINNFFLFMTKEDYGPTK